MILKKYRQLLSNLSYATFLNVVILLAPLITYPYLIRVLGKDLYGAIVYSFTVTMFFRLFVKFGFEVSAVKEVSVHSDDKVKLSEIFTSVVIIQIFFWLLGGLILFLLVVFTEKLAQFQTLLLFFSLYPLADILTAFWFFQGIQKMKYLTLIQLISSVFGISVTFLLIKSPEHYLYVPLIQVASALLGGAVSLVLITKVEQVGFCFVSLSVILGYFKSSLMFFYSRFSAVIYTQLNVILLENFTALGVVAYYDLANKIVRLFMIPNQMIDTVFYPYMAKNKDLQLALKVLFARIVMALFFMLVIYLFGEFFIRILGGKDMEATLNILYFLSPLLVLYAVTHFLGSSLLIPFGYSKVFNYSVFFSLCVYILFVSVLYFFDLMNVYSILLAMIVTEVGALCYRLYFCIKYRLILS